MSAMNEKDSLFNGCHNSNLDLPPSGILLRGAWKTIPSGKRSPASYDNLPEFPSSKQAQRADL
jgi:hypothetical protein